jgi:hypothetical protein
MPGEPLVGHNLVLNDVHLDFSSDGWRGLRVLVVQEILTGTYGIPRIDVDNEALHLGLVPGQALIVGGLAKGCFHVCSSIVPTKYNALGTRAQGSPPAKKNSVPREGTLPINKVEPDPAFRRCLNQSGKSSMVRPSGPEPVLFFVSKLTTNCCISGLCQGRSSSVAIVFC